MNVQLTESKLSEFVINEPFGVFPFFSTLGISFVTNYSYVILE